ncbi:MAG TPA: hypothetical protein VMQ61_00950 [Thermoanaerobaculia bacterium]|nr:hypothetical protein [Thermoanaerobaculia bacterium]
MRTRTTIAILFLASSLSCRQTATEPTVERKETPVTPTPISTPNLEGGWSGAMTFGSDYRKPCAPSEGVVLQITQRGSDVTSTLRTNCEGMLRLRGTLSGTYLAVDLLKEDGTSIGKLTGQAASTRISLENRDGAPWDYGDPTIGLELRR